MRSKFLLFLSITFLGTLSYQLGCAQQKSEATMIVRVKTKGFDSFLSPDSIMRVWFKGSLIRTCVLQKVQPGQGIDTKLAVQPTISKVRTNNTTENFAEAGNRIEYIRNYETGEALDISYRNGLVIGVFKRTERSLISHADSTEKIWAGQEKTIAGHATKKLVLVNKFTKLRDTLFIAPDLKGIIHPAYKYLEECPLEYEDHLNRYDVKSISLTTVQDAVFAIPRSSRIFTDKMSWLSFLANNQSK